MHTHSTRDKRVALATLLAAGLNQSQAARELKVDRSTISRELSNNSNAAGKYYADYADRLAKKRRRNSKKGYRLIENNSSLANRIESMLDPLTSPETVAHEVGIVHETIYAWINRARRDLLPKLPQRGRKRRRYGSKREKKQGWTANVRPIDERPAIVETRTRIGDWEGDTAKGKHGALLPYTERTSRFVVAALIPNEGADVTHTETRRMFAALEPETITYDRGSSFSLWQMIEKDTGADVYFARARHPWERGTEENTIGRIRRIFPKGFDFASIVQEDLDQVTWKMNHTPRKILNWRTPCAVLGKCCVSS